MALIAARGGGNAGGAAVGIRLSYVLVRFAKRLWPRAIRYDATLPSVLLLRSFSDDNRRIERAVRWFDTPNLTSIEESLAKIVGASSNVIAVADPRMVIPPLGASLVWLRNDEWQVEVERWMTAASHIVLIINDTEGVGWELERVLATYRDKTTFVFPSLTSLVGKEDVDGMRQRWRTFAECSGRHGLRLVAQPPHAFGRVIGAIPQGDQIVCRIMPVVTIDHYEQLLREELTTGPTSRRRCDALPPR